MISDVLSDAVHNIDTYLNGDVFDDCYTGDIRTRILILRSQMDAMRMELDLPPTIKGVEYETRNT